jgi:serine/threonine-protein kinase RsbW
MSAILHKTLARDVGDLIGLAPEVDDFLPRHAVSPAAVARVRVVLEEVILNLINHGTGWVTGVIDVRVEVEPGRVVVVIEDDCAPFDPRSAPEFDKTRPLEERSAGGMGIQLVRSLAAEMDYQQLPGRNRLRVVVASP